MTVILSAIAFILLLSVLVVIHEWGHFAAARKAGVVVEEFGFGLPPKARLLFKQGGTDFTLNWIPFGGFVRLKGEGAMTEKERRGPGSFSSASISARVVILVAGVFMNFILAVALLTFGFFVGRWIPTYFTLDEMRAAETKGVLMMDTGVVIEKVVSGGGAAKVGVPEQSLVVAVDGVAVTDTYQVKDLQAGKDSVTYDLMIGEGFTMPASFDVVLDEGKSGVMISVMPYNVEAPDRNLWEAFVLALRESKVMTKQTVLGIGQLFSSLVRTASVPEGITGLVGIAQLTHMSVQEGFMTYVRLVALLSLSLAVLNILPFPALDGGRLIFVLIEGVTGRPVNQQLERTVNMVGFMFLLALIFLITFYDVIRLF